MPNPLFRQVERVIARTIDLQSGIANQQSGVVAGQHFVEIRFHGSKRPSSPEPFFEQNLRQRHRGHRRSIERDGANLLDRYFADQQNRTNRLAGRNRQVRKNLQVGDRSVCRSRNNADIGATLGQLPAQSPPESDPYTTSWCPWIQANGLDCNNFSANSTVLSLDLDCRIAIPLYLAALTERLQARPVRIVFDFVRSLLGEANPSQAKARSRSAARSSSSARSFTSTRRGASPRA